MLSGCILLNMIQSVKTGSCNSSGTVSIDTVTLKVSLFLSSELGEIPTLKTLQVFGIVPDSTLQLLKEALPHLQINCSHFTTIARPTVGNKSNPEIWGIKCRLTLQKPTCLWSIYCRMVSPFFWNRENSRKPNCRSTQLFLFLVFPLPSSCKYIQEAFERENYEVLLFINDCKSFCHCYALTSLSVGLNEILGKWACKFTIP